MAINRRWAGTAGVLAAGALCGGIIAGTLTANAATGISGTPNTSRAPNAASQQGASPLGAPPAAGGHAGETPVSGATSATLKAAALKAVPGGTVVRAETDSGDAAYEVHMTKSDDTEVTVKFDKKLHLTAVEDGIGK